MARTKLIPDSEILFTVLQHILDGGERSASFAAISSATGLSAPALVLRFSNQPAMCQAALLSGWATLTARTDTPLTSPKDVQNFLKSQADYANIPAMLIHSQRDSKTCAAAESWRAAIESALALYYGGGEKGHSAAGLVFAAWQGRLAWTGAGGKTFRLGEVIRTQA